MRKCSLIVLLAAAATSTVRADNRWELISLRPFDIEQRAAAGDWQESWLSTLFQTGGGFAAAGNEESQPTSLEPVHGQVAFRLEHASWGFGVSELRADFKLGDYCTDRPRGRIDWAATKAAIENSAAFRDGYLFFVENATNENKRILFTRGGEVDVPWVLQGGEEATRKYVVGQTTSTRPYRIFWTETPFNGPKIDLSAHPHVRLLGDPDIVKPVYEATSTSQTTGISNLVRGVVFDATSKTLRSYCRVISEERRDYDGPEGQFVLAYYDSGLKDNLIATVVVEACRPDVTRIKASVGDELRPTGGGYEIDGLESEIVKGATAQQGDKASPYLYKHSGANNWSSKNKAVFAISPTDETTTGTGEPAPWRADIYWKAPDPLDTLWPFEEDWYLISWPTDSAVFVVSDDQSSPGIPVYIPTNYNTAAVCDYQDPPVIASIDSDKVLRATGAGNFTLKLTADDDIWFVPVRSVLRTDENYAMSRPVNWEIGTEIKLIGGSAALNTSNAVQNAISFIPGYIYENGSTGRRNWNPRLYRRPGRQSATEGIYTDENSDPYQRLESAIYPVNTSTSPIEVWWYTSALADGMPWGIEFPCVVQKYNAVWPDDRDTQSIVIASCKGSDGLIPGSSNASLYIDSPETTAYLDSESLLSTSESGGTTFGFWFNASPHAAGKPEVTEGLLTTLFGDDGTAYVEIGIGRGDGGLVLKINGIALYSVGTDSWNYVAVTLDPPAEGTSRKARVFINALEIWHENAEINAATAGFHLALGARTDGGAVVKPSATGVAIDSLSVWSLALTAADQVALWSKIGGNAEADLALQCRFSFDSEIDLSPVTGTDMRFAYDAVRGRILVSEGALSMAPGAPELKSGLLQTAGGVSPELYYENNPSATGFNPNDEHAFLREKETGWEVNALRCDLADAEGSLPFVLAMYNEQGKGAMRVYDVKLTNETYKTLGNDICAGRLFIPPYPLNILDQADNSENSAKTVTMSATNSFGEATSDYEVVYRDRHRRMWGRRDGAADAYYHYAFQEGFWFPGLNSQPEPGTLVPWLCRANTNRVDLLRSLPMPWRWNVAWPSDDEIGTMRVAQTLTKAADKLPEVWSAASMAVAFPAPASDAAARERVVHLIDPTAARYETLPVKSDFPGEYAFTLGAAGTTQLRFGKYYFTGLPPSVSDRFYVDAANSRIALVGQRIEKATGGVMLQINVLTDAERQAIKDICKATGDAKSCWDNAVDRLAVSEIEPSPQDLKTGPANTYIPADHYALVASGEGSGYVTLIENDSPDTTMVDEGAPVSMHVLKVLPELHSGSLTVITDPLNKLSEQLTVSYTEPFGNAEDNFEFEWRRTETTADGSVPTNYPAWTIWGSGGKTATSILLGGSGADLKDLQNMYYAMRYRAKENTPAREVTGDKWSEWCGPALAEGWVQRVLNSVTPFAQRCADFSSYESDIAYSMLEQIGRPYRGNVALNNDNLGSIGLLELYHTVLDKAEGMSLKLGQATDPGVNKQLLLAASRISELYGILGDEAYSDAKNPTISMMYNGTDYSYDSLSGTAFSFQNQVPTLLDEELALLRGRTSATAPGMSTYPYFNRLLWNFTKDPTEGEVAYVNNYMISGVNGEITAEQAAAQYPQGHGDAFGHYLSEVKSFYHLVRNPYFDWYASMTEMLIGDSVVNVDYFDEEKFASAAGDLAKTALDVMDLTARKAWRDSDGVNGAGYFDADSEQAFGYGEWATRGGFGAICNWAVVNSLLPTNGNSAAQIFEDKGIKRIDRRTASSLFYLPTAVADIERKLLTLGSGMNPLGLADNAIPFDIDPGRLQEDFDTPMSHFEQIRERALKALNNASAVLDYAHRHGSRLAQIASDAATAAESQETVENDYNKRLIAIYGTPYSGDIGPGGLYRQGYNGPDIYHYQYIDLAPYGLKAIDSQLSKKIVTYKDVDGGPVASAGNLDYTEKITLDVQYTLTPDGIPQPASSLGTRQSEGSIQYAYRDFIAAYSGLKIAMANYDSAVAKLDVHLSIARTKLRQAGVDLAFDELINAAAVFKAGVDMTTSTVINSLTVAKELAADADQLAYQASPKIIGAGLTVNTDPSAIVGGVSGLAANTVKTFVNEGIYGAKQIAGSVDFWYKSLSVSLKAVKDGFDYYSAEVSSWERLNSALGAVKTAFSALAESYSSVIAAEQAYRAQISAGEALREELAMQRRHWSNTATAKRYADMYSRIARNSALSKYATAYDTAQRYVFELAKVYDYETGLLSSDPLAGDSFLREIIAARSIGEKNLTTEAGGTLWDAVTRMSRNWDDSLKWRLGVTNPMKTEKWFSLRWSLFRIKPGEPGDEAWRTALRKYWKDDILSDPEFRRFCQPPKSDSADQVAEPGLIIPFSTSVNLAENFFGLPLIGGDDAYSSSDYAVKIGSAGLRFKGYSALTVPDTAGLAKNPNVYLVPVGRDYMRAPSATSRKTLAFNVVDQVMPLPFTIGSAELDDPDWLSTFSGLDGTQDSYSVIRRHSTMPVSDSLSSTRLFGRSVWNDRWILVIPASSLSSDRVTALQALIEGIDTDRDGMTDIPGISDIEIGIRAYSRSGN